MNNNPLQKGTFTVNDSGIGEVSYDMLQKRATEIALIAGRPKNKVRKSDWEAAERELTGESEIDPKEEILEAAPESKRWDPVHGSEGHEVPVFTSDDEDSEGRSQSEALVEEGVEEAEHDQMVQAARAQQKSDRDQ